MGVYDTATKLANEIKGSKEYKEFVKCMKKVKKDKNNEILLNEYKRLQYSLQFSTMNNRKLDKKSIKQMEDIQSKVNKNKDIYNYLLAEEKFNIFMDNINRMIAKTVKGDYE